MTPDRLRELTTALHWSVRGLAVVLGEHETTVRRWFAGTTRVPENVAAWLERLARPAFRQPLPDGWEPKILYQEPKK